MKISHILALGLLLLAGTSCVFYTDPVEHAGEVGKNSALLYGNFYYGQHFNEEPDPKWFTTGLWIKNVDTGRKLYVEFKDTNSVYAVAVKPGWYRIMGFVRSDNEHGVKNRSGFHQTNTPAALAEPFEAQSGGQIYIGDYIWETKLDYPLIHWNLKFITNNFDATTVEFRQRHPELLTTSAKSIFERGIRSPRRSKMVFTQ